MCNWKIVVFMHVSLPSLYIFKAFRVLHSFIWRFIYICIHTYKWFFCTLCVSSRLPLISNGRIIATANAIQHGLNKKEEEEDGKNEKKNYTLNQTMLILIPITKCNKMTHIMCSTTIPWHGMPHLYIIVHNQIHAIKLRIWNENEREGYNV